MNGEELKRIYEQLDARGKHHLETVALAELKHAVEGLQKADNGLLVAKSHNYAMEEGKRREREENAVG